MALEQLIEKAEKLLRYPFCKLIYKEYGFKSLIYRPIRLSGRKYISLGKSVNIWKSARIECISDWEGAKFTPNLKIGDNTSFEQNAHITCAGNIEIGHDCVFLGYAMVTNIDHDYRELNKNVLRQKIIVSDVKIGNYCFVGMNAKIFPGVTIGDNAIIGANSVVTHDVPSFSVVAGAPARIIKRYDFGKKEWVSI